MWLRVRTSWVPSGFQLRLRYVKLHQGLRLHQAIIARMVLPHRVAGAAVLAGLAVAAAAQPAVATPPRELTLHAVVTGGVNAWVAAVPLMTDGAREVVAVDEDGAAQFTVHAGLPVLVCAGADAMATECRTVLPERNDTIPFALSAGRRISARFFIGRAAAPRDTKVHLRIPVESRQPPLVPVRREKGQLVTWTVLDAQGVLSIDHLAPGEYILEAHLPGGRIDEQHISVPSPRRDSTGALIDELVELPPVRIEAGLELVVTVTDTAGQPITDAGVGILQRREEERDEIIFEARTGADGHVTISGLDPAVPGTLNCSAQGFARHEALLGVIPPTTTCVLERLAGLTGIIQDEARLPLQGAIATIGRETAAVDTTGRFRFRDLAPGTYEVRASAAGYRTAVLDVVLVEGDTADLGTVNLAPGETLTGRVVSEEDGKSIAGATVAIIDPPGGAITVTDDQGAFSLVGDPAHRQTIETRAAGFAPRSVQYQPSTRDDLVIHLQRPGALHVRAWSSDGEGPCAACRIVASSPALTRGITAAGDGTAYFEELPPGRYQVIREQAHAGASVLRVSGGGSVMADVRPRETTTIELGAPSGEVWVHLAPQSPVGWQLSYTSASDSGTATADMTGAYHIRKRRGEPSTLSLVQGMRGVRLAVIPADFASGTYTPRLASGAARATLTRNGQAAAGVFLELRSVETGAVTAWGWTNADGSIAFPFLSDGEYVLTLQQQPIGGTVRIMSQRAADYGVVALP